MSFEIIHKPTFTNQLLGIPRDRVLQVLEKVELLRSDPSPHGEVKKKLHGYAGNVFRLRSGDYRILYTYGDGWVTLLGVDDRKDVYKNGQLVAADEPTISVASIPDVDGWLLPSEQGAPVPVARTVAADSSTDFLPVKIESAWLEKLYIPARFHQALCRCETFDDLIAADVPDAVRDRVFDCVLSPNFDQVLQQPSYVTEDVSDLLRFVQGELVEFLLKLSPEQEKFVTWAVNGAGPTLVKGSPGTGKSTVALYRTRSLYQALVKSGLAEPRILFTTYTHALVQSSRQLLKRLMVDAADRVEVRTADSVAFEIVKAVDGAPEMVSGRRLRVLVEEARATAAFDGTGPERRAQAKTIERLTPDYLAEEFAGVIEARELSSLDQYLKAPRTGRHVRLNAVQRTALWRVYESFRRVLGRKRVMTWEQLRRRAGDIVRSGGWPERFDGVLIDEAQDLDPTLLRLLVLLCRTPDRIFITADANQSIYGSSFRWVDVHVHLRFQGRTGILRQNFRTTKEIDQAARSYLSAGAIEDVEPPAAYMQFGAPPAVRHVADPYDETYLLARFLQGAAREFRMGIGACAVLVPSEHAGEEIAARLSEVRVPAQFMAGRQLDLEARPAKVITLQSAKGLEFPIVAVAGFINGSLPGSHRQGDQDELEETLLLHRRTMFVGMTRAMRALLVALPAGSDSPLFQGFDAEHWNVGVVTAMS